MSAALTEVANGTLDIARFTVLIGPKRAAVMQGQAARMRRLMQGRVMWNVNSTAAGGGVAEMLQTLVHYGRGVGVDVRWLTLHAAPEFFLITKRLHNFLHGAPGDAGALGEAERDRYLAALVPVADALVERVHPGDVVLLHDPQTAGLVAPLRARGAFVAWRCHIGADHWNHYTTLGWQFLQPLVEPAHAHVFSRAAYVPSWLRDRGVWEIAPSIDPFSAKNVVLEGARVRALLHAAGIVIAHRDGAHAAFQRYDGSVSRLERGAVVLREGPPPLAGQPLVTQVSRWDRLKDMPGVMDGFAPLVEAWPDVHLALVGPQVDGVSDDPEGAAVYADCMAHWLGLPPAVRRRISLVTLPMADVEENAVLVNAVQRHAAIVVQKSLREGFGLTVTEAMWKRRPIVASAVGGIRDQIEHDVHGLLVENPTDLVEFAAHLRTLLANPQTARRLARNAYRRCVTQFLPPRHLGQYVDLVASLLGSAGGGEVPG
jgi:trehalose synthase